jgi:hypothetical protein
MRGCVRPAGIVRSQIGLINPPIGGGTSFTGFYDVDVSAAGCLGGPRWIGAMQATQQAMQKKHEQTMSFWRHCEIIKATENQGCTRDIQGTTRSATSPLPSLQTMWTRALSRSTWSSIHKQAEVKPRRRRTAATPGKTSWGE